MTPDSLRALADRYFPVREILLDCADAWQRQYDEQCSLGHRLDMAQADNAALREALQTIADMINTISGDDQLTAGDAYFAQAIARRVLASQPEVKP
jgi:hypothetical protein